MAGRSLSLESDGARYIEAGAIDFLPELDAIATALSRGVPGSRLHGVPALAALLMPDGPIATVAARAIGSEAQAVRAVPFDKTPSRNWSLAWHQDRTIVVRQRIDVDGFGPWTVKQGLVHVSPPFALLQRMVTVRVHLDDVPSGNAPLLIAPGSHREGRIAEDKVEATVRRLGQYMCLAHAGDIWLYATPILHASSASARPLRRRVLQIDFSADPLPGGLAWLGV
ncbi:phytanoyl-CoA dioxygenase family protein [Sphingomonas naphthae]|uniref:Phytanoyl-CoA dioxygenase family protein n=1 Tax=Sphingomonas naphthae TaxID=1813468 RepID=A0ABY7TJL4_9SPHN|nr:phytanoyl-CoA dioxygenase family protein [Sphingomonas naphthae]WCT73228.1 phytanoyl-CoA dioxygenase family protein [Sphingomonas naphthae]